MSWDFIGIKWNSYYKEVTLSKTWVYVFGGLAVVGLIAMTVW